MEVTMPRLDTAAKARLARSLTDAYADSTGMDRERIGIRFQEYGPGETAYAGKLDADRRFVHIVLYCPRQSRKIKQAMVGRINTGLKEVLDLQGCRPVIHIQEHPYGNIGVDGELLSDRFPELAEREFCDPPDED